MRTRRHVLRRKSSDADDANSTASLNPVEPNFETACGWWPDLRQYWTAVGWREHLFRFNVFFNGAILAQPDLNRRTEAWKDQGVHLRFFSPGWANWYYGHYDDGRTRQGWKSCAAPVLWSRWGYAGAEWEQQVFAHIPGGEEVVTGIEPLFAWVRFTIVDRMPAIQAELPPHGRQGIVAMLNRPYATPTTREAHNIHYDRANARYPRKLQPDRPSYNRRFGWRLLEPDGSVRLGTAAGDDCIIDVPGVQKDQPDFHLHFWVKAQVGAKFDLLLPMLPTARDVFDRELALGFDAALCEANACWSNTPRTAARVRVPEEPLNEAITHSLKAAYTIAEKNPADGCYSALTGSWAYTNLWPTPVSMLFTGVLDLLGHHDLVARQLALFQRYQGTVKAPGDAYPKHLGYLSSPKTLTSNDWLSDHGALLYAITTHALLTGDRAFRDNWTESIVLACDFIRQSRAIRGHGGIEGVLPPAAATDRGTQIQGVWNDGWNYKGYVTAIRLLHTIGHPRAEEFAVDAADYRRVWTRAIRAATRRMPTWTDARGRRHHLVPTTLSGDWVEETRHPFYLDTGPLFLVYAGLLDANDPLMISMRQWFRPGGPPWRQYRRDSSTYQISVLDHEMSSCEPMYSWNGYHSWQLADRPRFLECMYSLFAGGASRQTHSFVESRGGISGLSPMQTAIHLARLAVIDDQITPGELHLFRLAPHAWLLPGSQALFEQMPTEFGPVTLESKVSRDGRTLSIRLKPDFRSSPRRIVFHTPSLPLLGRIRLNGKAFDASRHRLVLLL